MSIRRLTAVTGAGSESSAAALADEVAAFFGGVFERIDALDRQLTRVCSADRLTAADVTEAMLPLADAMLRDLPLFGAGFVAAPGFLADHHHYLAWWQGDEQRLLEQAAAPSTGDPFDYARMEWYRTPVTSGRRHVTGPYVDYVCSDEYILTATQPVLVDGRPVGVVGADLLLETFESLMLPAVRAAGATLVNHYRRVVVSADPRLPAGRLLRAEDHPVAVGCGDLPLRVVGRGTD